MNRIDSTNYTELTNSDKLTLVKYAADWCGPCKVLTPMLEGVLKNYGDSINAGEVNIDSHGELAVKDGVRGVPTIVFYKNGVALDRIVGLKQASEYIQKIESLK